MLSVPAKFQRATEAETLAAVLDSYEALEREFCRRSAELSEAEKSVSGGFRFATLRDSVAAMSTALVAANAKAVELISENDALKARVAELEAVQTDAAVLAVLASQGVAA